MRKFKKLFDKIITKRRILISINIIAFIFIFAYFLMDLLYGGWYRSESIRLLFILMVIQCVFTFLSLIVYYLSIMADALNKKYKEQENKDKN